MHRNAFFCFALFEKNYFTKSSQHKRKFACESVHTWSLNDVINALVFEYLYYCKCFVYRHFSINFQRLFHTVYAAILSLGLSKYSKEVLRCFLLSLMLNGIFTTICLFKYTTKKNERNVSSTTCSVLMHLRQKKPRKGKR